MSTRTSSSSRSGTSAASATARATSTGGSSSATPARATRTSSAARPWRSSRTAIRARFERVAYATGGAATSEGFLANLQASIDRFNELAGRGVDEDFGRGERAVQQLFNGDVKDEPGRTNPTMWPIAGEGPYYAALVTGGTLDTKGGPKTTSDGQVVDDMDRPIPGLYGVGNCVASPSARAYWAGGGTLGPIIAYAYRAARAAHAEPVRTASLAGA